jgi:hypothetical protein
MIIMWMNSDGTATLSQRKAPTEVMPTIDSNPPRKASFSSALSVVWQPHVIIVFRSQPTVFMAAIIFQTFLGFHTSSQYPPTLVRKFGPNNFVFL